MPANVETAVYANTPAWHGEGVVLDTKGDKGLTVEEALRESGLGWTVEKVPPFTFSRDYAHLNDPKALDAAIKSGMSIPLADLVRIHGRFGTQRTTDGKVFGTVGTTWQPVQNHEGFKIVDDVIAQAGGKTWVESAISLDGGKKVVIMVHLEDSLQIAGESYASYLSFLNGHDGRTSVTAICHDMRIVCQNTQDIAVGEARDTGRLIRVRHTTKAGERIKEAAQILGLRNKRNEELARMGEWFVEQTISDDEFAGFLESLLPIEETGTPAATMMGDRRGEIANVYFDAKNLDSIRGTRWGALQSVIEYSDHRRKFKAGSDGRIKAQLGLAASPIKDAAVQILRDKKLRPIAA